ncbi:MAG: TRAP transporter substrate-binding protein DctP, partial [Spirochaetales bacterium]|nr:TRAP transporter substrate-binding protein DctP [Spirochaetales bacterium]MCF7939360.1 TRAP transporter substrate-binding protein DctP [Spirochaetales bacterium]
MRKTGVPESGNRKNRERRINKKAARRTGILAVVLILLFSAAALPALTIKLGSVAPAGPPWDKGLKQMAAEWHEISDGRIDVKIYPGGIVGTEPDMIRKMRIGQLQAAVFTSLGMNSISQDVMALSIPFLIRNDAELDYLLEKITPELNERMERSGFTVIAWAPAGWATVFAKGPVV